MSTNTSNLSVINMWDKVSLWCLNHDEPIEMKIISNTEIIKTPFYACSSAISGNNATATFNDASGNNCANRINLTDYQGLVMKFFDIVAENGITSDYTGMSFFYKGTRQKIMCRVLKYNDSKIKLGIKNISILGGNP